MMAEANGSCEISEKALESDYFPTNMAHGLLGFQICSPDVTDKAWKHVANGRKDQKRPETEADGRWRKLTGSEGCWETAVAALESADFPINLAHRRLGFQI